MWEYRARHIEALDGDTIRLLVDLGFHVRHQIDLRLLDVWAPELNQDQGPETRDVVESWLDVAASTGLDWPLRIRTQINRATEPTEVRTFTRYVGDVYSIEPVEQWLNDTVRRFLNPTPTDPQPL
jgi:hypothetical protein